MIIAGKVVVGGGSHVAVMFDSAGTLEALDIDWPECADWGRTVTRISPRSARADARQSLA